MKNKIVKIIKEEILQLENTKGINITMYTIIQDQKIELLEKIIKKIRKIR